MLKALNWRVKCAIFFLTLDPKPQSLDPSTNARYPRASRGWRQQKRRSTDSKLTCSMRAGVQVALSMASFILNDFVLFNDVALKTIEDIEETGVFRELTATAPYQIRQQWIEVQEEV
eukprot:950710-Rhodomonas_salina.3